MPFQRCMFFVGNNPRLTFRGENRRTPKRLETRKQPQRSPYYSSFLHFPHCSFSFVKWGCLFCSLHLSLFRSLPPAGFAASSPDLSAAPDACKALQEKTFPEKKLPKKCAKPPSETKARAFCRPLARISAVTCLPLICKTSGGSIDHLPG